MPFRKRTALLVLIVLTVLAVLVRFLFSTDINLERYARKVEKSLREREAEAAAFAGEIRFIPDPVPSTALLRASWSLKPYNIAWYQGDSLLYQLNARLLPEHPADSVNGEVVFQEGKQVYYAKPLPFQGDPAIRAIAWIAVWEEGSGFTGLPGIPGSVMPSFGHENRPGVEKAQEEKLFSLVASGPVRDPFGQGLLTFLFLGIALVSLYLLNGFAAGLARKYSPWLGALFLLLLAAGIQVWVKWPWAQAQWEAWGAGQGILQTTVEQQTLGILLLNSTLLLWFMVFFHRYFQEVRFPALPTAALFALSAVNYLAIVAGMIVVAQTVRNMVFRSDLNIYLDNIFQIDGSGMTGILVLVMLLLAFFLFSHRMIMTIISTGLSPGRRMAAFAVALAVSVPVFLWTDIPLPLAGFVLSAIVFVVTLDLFADTQTPNLTWMIFLLVVVSLLTSLMLSSFRLGKEDEFQQNLAKKLSVARDPVAEQMLAAFPDTLQNPEAWLKENSYLNAFYRLDTTALLPASAFPGIDSLDGKPAYALGPHGVLKKTPHAGLPPLSSLVNPLTYKGLPRLNEFEYALYHRGALTDQSPNSLFSNRGPAAFQHKAVTDSGQVDWIYQNPNGNTVIVRRSVDDLTGPISLTSFMLALFILIMPVLGLINHWFPFLPPSLEFLQTQRPALSNRIQLWVVGFLLASFVLIGLVSVWNFRKNSDYNQEVQIKSKLDAIRAEAMKQIRERDLSSPGPALFSTLEQLGRFHDTELMVFDPEGALASSSFSGFEGARWLGDRMPDNVRFMLQNRGSALVLNQDRIGPYPVKVVYLPIRAPSGELSAFLGLPFINQPSSWQRDLSGFISSLISVYVSLLLLAGALAIFIANSITQPISRLGESLRQLKLGKNEPLVYESNDELGSLIEEYNRTLEKLEESTRKLALTERETGWRQVARQVAHEIKNPLTPMALDIQRLQMSVRLKPEKAKELVDEISGQILEQIHILKGIASSFSHFGQMPETENSHFSIAELVEKVHGLFRNEKSGFAFHLELPEAPCEVYADKYQITRVLNNLYKNAIQAVPEDRPGQISARVSAANGRVLIEVRDNGTGIPEELRDKVFEPNFTTKSSGSGLGLAMSRSIVEGAKGRIWAEPAPEGGTSFFVELPLAEEGNS